MNHSFISVAIPFARPYAEGMSQYLGALGNLSDKRAPAEAAGLRERLDATDAVHFLSVNVVADGDDEKAHLVLEISADGNAADVLDRAAAAIDAERPELRRFMGLPLQGSSLADLFRRHQYRIGHGWFDSLGLTFSGTPGMRVARIREEARLTRLISQQILPHALDPSSALNTLRQVRTALWDKHAEKWAFVAEAVPGQGWKPPAKPRAIAAALASAVRTWLWPLVLAVIAAFAIAYFWRLPGGGAWRAFWSGMGAAAIVTVAEILLVLGAYALLRWKEEHDPAPDVAPDAARVAGVMRRENHAAQNHLFGVSPMKPGLLRRLALRLVFSVIGDYGGQRLRPGYLADIGTIHFARWWLLPGTGKLLFFSNYGGSWESYLEDFIEKAHAGLTGVWSNTREFPRTENLFGKGATDGDRFKRWARRQQHPSLIWYTGYPSLTTARIRLNAAIRQGLAAAATEAEAADWLACFGSAPRPPAILETPEIPTLVFGGLSPFRYGQALVLRLSEQDAGGWLRRIEPLLSYGDRLPVDGALLVAFSNSGLRKLGLQPDDLATFPTAFQHGMAAEFRARALGDTGDNAPERWLWGGPKSPADAILLLYARTEGDLARDLQARRSDLAACGHQVLYGLPMQPLEYKDKQKQMTEAGRSYSKHNEEFHKEAFGFADGVSQPVVRGTRRWIASRDKNHVVEPGEIVLGYPDNRQYIPPSPSVSAAADPDNILSPLRDDPFRDRPDFSRPEPNAHHDLGRNGTFLVVRQLEQDVEGFWSFVEAESARLRDDPRAPRKDDDRREWIAAKLVGRWRDGTSLVRFPNAPGTAGSSPARPDNDFMYGADDPVGLRCPFGAHIRRANPRDSLAPGSMKQLKISNRHRILRVGRNYDAQPGLHRPGLFFMCVNADIERQFEFVQQTWNLAPSFHGLEAEVDCFSGRGDTSEMTVPTPSGPLCIQRLQDFVTVLGGGYFFMPGRRTVRYLAAAGRPGIAAAAPERIQ